MSCGTVLVFKCGARAVVRGGLADRELAWILIQAVILDDVKAEHQETEDWGDMQNEEICDKI